MLSHEENACNEEWSRELLDIAPELRLLHRVSRLYDELVMYSTFVIMKKNVRRSSSDLLSVPLFDQCRLRFAFLLDARLGFPEGKDGKVAKIVDRMNELFTNLRPALNRDQVERTIHLLYFGARTLMAYIGGISKETSYHLLDDHRKLASAIRFEIDGQPTAQATSFLSCSLAK